MSNERDRFWRKVRRAGPTDCWEWQAARQHFGHGLFHVPDSTNKRGRRLEKAHRYAWILERGEIPAGLCVLHSCDNPPCVNPAHLFLGTRADNSHDRDAKGRHVALIGDQHGNTRYPDAVVLVWKQLRESGAAISSIAARFGVGYHAVWQALRRRRVVA